MSNRKETLEKFYTQRAELKRELTQEFERRLKGLMEFYELRPDEIDQEKVTVGTISQSIPEGKTGFSLYVSVRKSIEEQNGKDFTLRDIIERVEELYPNALRPSVSAVLSKMAANKELEVVEQGSGKRASIYKLKSKLQ